MYAILGVLLLVVGAVMRYAIRTTFEDVDLAVVGYIFIAGGALSLLIAAVQAAGWMSSAGPRRYRTERHVSPDGDHVVEETRST